MPRETNALEIYAAAVKEIRELEQKNRESAKLIRRLEKEVVCDVVKGSRRDLSYGSIKISGIADTEISEQWEKLHKREERIESLKAGIEAMLYDLEVFVEQLEESEIRRILRLRYMWEDGNVLKWQQVAAYMGRGYTADSCRVKVSRYFGTWKNDTSSDTSRI